MFSVNQSTPRSVGIGHVDRPSQNTAGRLPSYKETDNSSRLPHHLSTDKVWLSDSARSFVPTNLVNLPRPGDAGADGELVASIRKIDEFLNQNPRMAESPFGKSVQTLMRGAAHLVTLGGSSGGDNFSHEATEKLVSSVRDIEAFLKKHPRVAREPFGQAVTQLGRAVVSTILGNGDNPAMTLEERISGTIKQIRQYLEAQPKIAAMPLGLAVDSLISGVQPLAEGAGIETDLQNLAKRIGHFVGAHPRLAESEFGQLIASLTRGILALAPLVPPSVEPPVVSAVRSDAAVPAAHDALPVSNGTDIRKAA